VKLATSILTLFLNLSLFAQSEMSTGVAIGLVIPAGDDLSTGYKVGLSFEPGLNLTLGERIDLGASVAVNGFMNNYSDNVTDYLILYGPVLGVTYKDLAIGKVKLQPLLGIGYLWGQDFFVSSGQNNSDRETTPILTSKGGYLRAGLSVPASERITVRLTYNVHRPVVSLSDEAKQFFAPYNINSPLYGSIMDFPSNTMSFDNIMIAIALKL
jgi:hypothetical protein